MATEPTLGTWIRQAATGLAFAGNSATTNRIWDELRALAARADAAERGAAALGSLVERLGVVHDDERYKAVWETAHWRRGPYQGPFYTDELAEATEALAAWRAITEGEVTG